MMRKGDKDAQPTEYVTASWTSLKLTCLPEGIHRWNVPWCLLLNYVIGKLLNKKISYCLPDFPAAIHTLNMILLYFQSLHFIELNVTTYCLCWSSFTSVCPPGPVVLLNKSLKTHFKSLYIIQSWLTQLTSRRHLRLPLDFVSSFLVVSGLTAYTRRELFLVTY